MVYEVYEAEDFAKLKLFRHLLDDEPIVHEEQLRLSERLKLTTFCTYFDALNLMIPSGLHINVKAMVSLVETDSLPELTKEQQHALSTLKELGGVANPLDISIRLGLSDLRIWYSLKRLGLVAFNEKPGRRVSDEITTMVRLSETQNDLTNLKLTPKQQKIIDFLESNTEVSLKELLYFTGVSRSVSDLLENKEYIEYFDIRTYRDPMRTEEYDGPMRFELSQEQQKVYDGIRALIDKREGAACLLEGVTGSGKTPVYIELSRYVQSTGRQTIIMVPEISLTPQLALQFKGIFGERIAILHSGLSLGERADEWQRAKDGLADIVIGTRSAVFAPFSNIGLIIMDEEQESTYKSESSPRYHARDVAKVRAATHNAVMLMSSATPSVESSYLAAKGRYHYFTLTERYNAKSLPDVTIVDMRDEVKTGNPGRISRPLLEELKNNLARGEQSVLLLNRRGYHTNASCMHCGEVLTCPNCSVALIYHKPNDRLMCHYCAYSETVPDTCKSCGSDYLKYTGAGTQRCEDELAALLPEARIMRMDADSTMARFAHQDKYTAFKRGEFDILLGTQMVAKGLDFPNVTLVGVISADSSLYSGSYKSYEMTFALLTQVVGRCGRGERQGRAIIQTSTPDNPIIRLAAKQDYAAFLKDELINRKIALYPPFCDLCIVMFVCEFLEQLEEGARYFADRLKELSQERYQGMPLWVLGPVEPEIFKVNNRYRVKLIIKCKNNKDFRELMRLVYEDFLEVRYYKRITAIIDIN